MTTLTLDSSSSSLEAKTASGDSKAKNKFQSLIPGLPNEIGELCLYRIPYPYPAHRHRVSTSWNNFFSHPSFLPTKNRLSLSLPYIFVAAFHKSTAKIQWQALELRSRYWFVLPSMPSFYDNATAPTSFSCTSLPREGKLFVFGGMGYSRNSIDTTLTYSTSTNQWSFSAPMRTPRVYSAAGNIGGKIIVAGRAKSNYNEDNDDVESRAELYDAKHDKWIDVAKMGYEMEIYDSIVLAGKFYVTQVWRWPFIFTPRGRVYDIESDMWQEMSKGMKEGWTGPAAVVGGRMVVMSDDGDCRLMVYESGDDTWEIVSGGDMFPSELVQRPFTLCGVEGILYVFSSGLNVAIGRLFEDDTLGLGSGSGLCVEWDVIEAPKAYQDFTPFISELIYA